MGERPQSQARISIILNNSRCGFAHERTFNKYLHSKTIFQGDSCTDLSFLRLLKGTILETKFRTSTITTDCRSKRNGAYLLHVPIEVEIQAPKETARNFCAIDSEVRKLVPVRYLDRVAEYGLKTHSTPLLGEIDCLFD